MSHMAKRNRLFKGLALALGLSLGLLGLLPIPDNAPDIKPSPAPLVVTNHSPTSKEAWLSSPVMRADRRAITPALTSTHTTTHQAHTLLGVMMWNGQTHALLSNNMGRIQSIRTGMDIDGWRVERIENTSVHLKKKQTSIEIHMRGNGHD